MQQIIKFVNYSECHSENKHDKCKKAHLNNYLF